MCGEKDQRRHAAWEPLIASLSSPSSLFGAFCVELSLPPVSPPLLSGYWEIHLAESRHTSGWMRWNPPAERWSRAPEFRGTHGELRSTKVSETRVFALDAVLKGGTVSICATIRAAGCARHAGAPLFYRCEASARLSARCRSAGRAVEHKPRAVSLCQLWVGTALLPAAWNGLSHTLSGASPNQVEHRFKRAHLEMMLKTKMPVNSCFQLITCDDTCMCRHVGSGTFEISDYLWWEIFFCYALMSNVFTP